MDPKVKAAIAAIPDDAWTAIRYPRALWDDQLRAWISDAWEAGDDPGVRVQVKDSVTARSRSLAAAQALSVKLAGQGWFEVCLGQMVADVGEDPGTSDVAIVSLTRRSSCAADAITARIPSGGRGT